MNDFLKNPWVIGIGGGIISGFIVYLISYVIMNKKNNSEYAQQIQFANSEVINNLKPYIVDNGLPNKEIMDSIISAVSRKYRVKKEEMYPLTIYCQELIYEIIGNVYVSNDKKREYTEQLSNYITTLKTDSIETILEKSTDIKSKADYRQRLNKQYSVMLSLTATLLTMCLTIATFSEKGKFVDFLINPFYKSNVLILSVAIICSCVLPLIIIILQKSRTMSVKEHTTIRKKNNATTIDESNRQSSI